LARAIVIEPQVLLFDEPLSNLDARLRIETRQSIRRLVNDLHITSIFVTHDQEEAMSIADDMAVMRDGLVLQQGSPAQCYQQPATAFVGRFLGRANILPLNDALRQHFPDIPAAHRHVLLRPEHLSLCDAADAVLSGSLRMLEFQGPHQRLHIDSDGRNIELVVPADMQVPALHSTLSIDCAAEHVRSYEYDNT
jgi:ABC-type sugar transport system ATPase subunit